eukprot:52485_1
MNSKYVDITIVDSFNMNVFCHIIQSQNISLLTEFIFFHQQYNKKMFNMIVNKKYGKNENITPIQLAIMTKNWNMIDILLEIENISVSNIKVVNVCHSMQNQIQWMTINLLIDKQCDILSVDNDTNHSIMSYVIHFHQHRVLQSILKHSDGTNLINNIKQTMIGNKMKKNKKKFTSIEIASEYGYIDIVDVMKQHSNKQSNVDQTDNKQNDDDDNDEVDGLKQKLMEQQREIVKLKNKIKALNEKQSDI